jgi:hypothetical protein
VTPAAQHLDRSEHPDLKIVHCGSPLVYFQSFPS